MTQQNILIRNLVSWEGALISTNQCHGVGESAGVQLVLRELKRNLSNQQGLRGGEHLNLSGTFLFGCIPIGQTSAWQSHSIAQRQKHSPGMRDM